MNRIKTKQITVTVETVTFNGMRKTEEKKAQKMVDVSRECRTKDVE